MISLEFEFGYDKATNELIVFEFGDEVARFDYDLYEEDDGFDDVYITITHLGIYEDGELIEVRKCKK